MKQTAVDYLIEQLQAPCRGIPSHIIEKAKEMEKQQILNAYKRESVYMKSAGCTDEQINKSSIKYYKETYGK